ncbi:MAG: glycosyltransferase family 4 protein, partial [Anaerolineales bacterium]
MKVIGIAGPTNLYPYQKYFKDKALPKGLGGTVLPPLIEKLIQRGYKVVLFTLSKDVCKPFSLESECIRIWVAPYRLRHRARDFFNVERQFLTRIMDLEKEIDIIHAHWTYEFAMAALSSKKPVLVTAHDAPLSILRYDLTPYRFIRTLMAYWVSYKAHNLTAVSEYVANHFRKFMGYKGNIYVIPNGMYPLRDTTAKCPQTNRPLIFAGVIGGWNKMRNSKTLIKAFNEFLKRYPQSELWLFGPDHGRQEKAEQWAIRQNFAEKIRFYG